MTWNQTRLAVVANGATFRRVLAGASLLLLVETPQWVDGSGQSRQGWDEFALDRWFAVSSRAEPDQWWSRRRAESPKFFFGASDRLTWGARLREFDATDESGPIDQAINVRKGVFRYFDHHTAPLGFPPDWHLNPFTANECRGTSTGA